MSRLRTCDQDWDLRINGTDSGRLEVCLNGTWGTICDDQWNDLDATGMARVMQRLREVWAGTRGCGSLPPMEVATNTRYASTSRSGLQATGLHKRDSAKQCVSMGAQRSSCREWRAYQAKLCLTGTLRCIVAHPAGSSVDNGPTGYRIWLAQAQCTGSESSLGNCAYGRPAGSSQVRCAPCGACLCAAPLPHEAASLSPFPAYLLCECPIAVCDRAAPCCAVPARSAPTTWTRAWSATMTQAQLRTAQGSPPQPSRAAGPVPAACA
jgi:hypothetical protein